MTVLLLSVLPVALLVCWAAEMGIYHVYSKKFHPWKELLVVRIVKNYSVFDLNCFTLQDKTIATALNVSLKLCSTTYSDPNAATPNLACLRAHQYSGGDSRVVLQLRDDSKLSSNGEWNFMVYVTLANYTTVKFDRRKEKISA